jgi:beta-lactamase class A
MTLVMDGVRRVPEGTGVAVRRAAVDAPKLKDRPAAKPISRATSRSMSGVRYVTGMDGVRRPVAAPAQRPMRAAAAVAAAAGPQMPARPAHNARRLWRRRARAGLQRRAVGFALVATALVTSGMAVRAVATPRTTTAHAETVPAAATVAPSPALASAPKSAGDLQALINNVAAANPDKLNIVVKDLKTGETASYAASRQTESASLYKLFVAKSIFQRIDIGQLSPTDQAGGGTGRTIDGCLTIMINISDNDCGRALGTILGWGTQNQALGLEGYKQTDLSSPQQTSAADVAQLLERLYNSTLVSAGSGAEFLALLKSQRVNNRLPVGLPTGTAIAHKTGDLDGYVHDAGIVYGPKTDYLVVAMSGPWDAPGNAAALLASLSQQLWNYFEQ